MDDIEYHTNPSGGQDAIVRPPMAIADAAGLALDGKPADMVLPPGVKWEDLDDEQRQNLLDFHDKIRIEMQGYSVWVVPLSGDPHPEGHEWAVIQKGSNAVFGTYRDPEHAEIVGVAFARHLAVALSVQGENGKITTTTFPRL